MGGLGKDSRFGAHVRGLWPWTLARTRPLSAPGDSPELPRPQPQTMGLPGKTLGSLLKGSFNGDTWPCKGPY